MARKKKILLIDDNIDCYDDCVEILKKHYDVSIAPTLMVAEVYLVRNHYDLAIIDIMMPIYGHNQEYKNEYRVGFDFYCLRIRKKHPNMITVFWSALDSVTILDYFNELGGKPTNVYIVDKIVYHIEEFEDFFLSILPPDK